MKNKKQEFKGELFVSYKWISGINLKKMNQIWVAIWGWMFDFWTWNAFREMLNQICLVIECFDSKISVICLCWKVRKTVEIILQKNIVYWRQNHIFYLTQVKTLYIDCYQLTMNDLYIPEIVFIGKYL